MSCGGGGAATAISTGGVWVWIWICASWPFRRTRRRRVIAREEGWAQSGPGPRVKTPVKSREVDGTTSRPAAAAKAAASSSSCSKLRAGPGRTAVKVTSSDLWKVCGAVAAEGGSGRSREIQTSKFRTKWPSASPTEFFSSPTSARGSNCDVSEAAGVLRGFGDRSDRSVRDLPRPYE